MADHNRQFIRRSIYIDDEGYEKLKEKAKFYQLPISRYVREVAINDKIPIHQQDTKRLISELHKIGSNLNQIAKKYNKGKNPDDDLSEILEYLLDEFEKLDDKLSELK